MPLSEPEDEPKPQDELEPGPEDGLEAKPRPEDEPEPRNEDEDEELEPTLLERWYARTGVPERLALWAPRIVGAALAGAVAAFVSAFLPWAHARLSDRGADLLVVTSDGTDYGFTGRWVIGLSVLAAVAGTYLLLRPLSRWVPALMALVGAGIIAAAVVGEGNNGPIVHKLSRLRIGTVEVVNPTAHTTVGYGLWLTILAGGLLALASLVWLVLVARRPAE